MSQPIDFCLIRPPCVSTAYGKHRVDIKKLNKIKPKQVGIIIFYLIKNKCLPETGFFEFQTVHAHESVDFVKLGYLGSISEVSFLIKSILIKLF